MLSDRTNRGNFSPLSLGSRRESAMKAEIKRLQDQVLTLRVQVSRLELQRDNSDHIQKQPTTTSTSASATTSTSTPTPSLNPIATATTSTNTPAPPLLHTQSTQVEFDDVPRETKPLEEQEEQEEQEQEHYASESDQDDSFLSAQSFHLGTTELRSAQTFPISLQPARQTQIEFQQPASPSSSNVGDLWKQELVGTPSTFKKETNRKTTAVDSIRLSRRRLATRTKPVLSDSTFQLQREVGNSAAVSFKANDELVQVHHEEDKVYNHQNTTPFKTNHSRIANAVDSIKLSRTRLNTRTKPSVSGSTFQLQRHVGDSAAVSFKTDDELVVQEEEEEEYDENVHGFKNQANQENEENQENHVVTNAWSARTYDAQDQYEKEAEAEADPPHWLEEEENENENVPPATRPLVDDEAYRLAGTGHSPLDALPKPVLQGMLYAYWKDRQKEEQTLPSEVALKVAPGVAAEEDTDAYDPDEERRTDPANGYAYTLDEFLAHYGGVAEWKVAEVWNAGPDAMEGGGWEEEEAWAEKGDTRRYQEYADYSDYSETFVHVENGGGEVV